MACLLLAFFTKKPALRRRMGGIAAAIFFVFGNSFLVNEVALRWEYPPTRMPADSAQRIAVVLTGGMMNVMKETPDNRFLLGQQADRAGQALYLYKTGAVQKILISGGQGGLPFQTKPVSDEGRMTVRFLTLSGVRPGDIMLETRSRNTHENAVFSAKLLHDRFHTNQCVLITSALHMRRSMGCFQKENVRVTPFPGNFLSSRRSFSPGDWLLPHEQSFADSSYLLKELVGYAVYWVMGYL